MSDCDVHPQPRRVAGFVSALALIAALMLGAHLSGAAGVRESRDQLVTWVVEGGHALAVQAAPALVGSADAGEIPDGQAVATLAAQANAAVVTVTNLQEIASPFSGSNEPQQVGVGSGFILDTEGHVVTNNHVVTGADAVSVQFSDGTEVDATLVGRDQFQDVAVLQLDLSSTTVVPGVVTLGMSDEIEFGDTVVAIGTALGAYPNTVTTGIVEAVDRALDTGRGYELAHLIQHDAELWPGNSGGPLLNLDGEVIGMNVAGSTTSGQGTAGEQVGFAIDINAVMEIATELIEDGEVARPFLGIESAPAGSGHRVADLVAGGPAEEAGIEVANVITAVEGHEVDSNHPLLNLLFEHDPGDTITLTVERDAEQQQVDVILDKRPAETP